MLKNYFLLLVILLVGCTNRNKDLKTNVINKTISYDVAVKQVALELVEIEKNYSDVCDGLYDQGKINNLENLLRDAGFLGSKYSNLKTDDQYRLKGHALAIISQNIKFNYFLNHYTLSARERLSKINSNNASDGKNKSTVDCSKNIRAYEFGREMAFTAQMGARTLERAIEEFGSNLGIVAPFDKNNPCVKLGFDDAMNNIPSPYNKEGKSWNTF